MSWKYSQSSGDLISPIGEVIATGYSGAPGFRNDPLMEDIIDKGPIPKGMYTIGEPVDTVKHGPFFLPLIPDATNDMYTRSGFGVHGERLEGPSGLASEGCIILSHFIREKIWLSGDHQLEVII
jgi:hypothetical protein